MRNQYRTYTFGALCCLSVFLTFVPVLSAAVYKVTNNSGDVAVTGSLPWALNAAYYNPGDHQIVFEIPGSGPHTIYAQPIAAGFAWFVGNQGGGRVTLDATTQPGYRAGRPAVWIDFNGVPAGINVVGRGQTVKGLALYNFRTVGLALLEGAGAGGHTVTDCWVGFVEVPGGYFKNTNYGSGYQQSIGIGVACPDNYLAGNTISGVYNGITMGTDPVMAPNPWNYYIAYNNQITLNRIGTTPDGNAAIGNLSDAVFLGDSASYNYIYNNIIGANLSAGIEILGSSGWVNFAWGNLCGVGAGGQNLGNGQLGILVANASQYNYIGFYVPNYFYYNGLGGASLGLNDPAAGTSGAAHNNQIAYNYFYANNTAYWSQGVGVAVTGGSYYNLVMANNIYGHLQHGVILSRAYGTWVVYNYLGYYDWNWGFGVYSQYSSGNVIGSNGLFYNWLGGYGSLSSADYVY